MWKPLVWSCAPGTFWWVTPKVCPEISEKPPKIFVPCLSLTVLTLRTWFLHHTMTSGLPLRTCHFSRGSRQNFGGNRPKTIFSPKWWICHVKALGLKLGTYHFLPLLKNRLSRITTLVLNHFAVFRFAFFVSMFAITACGDRFGYIPHVVVYTFSIILLSPGWGL